MSDHESAMHDITGMGNKAKRNKKHKKTLNDKRK